MAVFLKKMVMFYPSQNRCSEGISSGEHKPTITFEKQLNKHFNVDLFAKSN
jgi:hypothetical protein